MRLDRADLAAGERDLRTDAEGYTVRSTNGGCGGPEYEYFFKVTRDGTVTQTSRNKIGDGDPNCVEGRRPAGMEASKSKGWLRSVDEHLREIASMETAAIWAFDELCADLSRHGAPAELEARARKARAEEVQHTRIMNELLDGRGITRRTAEAPPARSLSLLELAMLNATEGEVRETYGALVAAYQAAYATDPELRAAFGQIARDEAVHAELSLDLAMWLDSMLSADERLMVEAARREALARLYEECGRLQPSVEVAREAGMPTAQAALMMLDGLTGALRMAA